MHTARIGDSQSDSPNQRTSGFGGAPRMPHQGIFQEKQRGDQRTSPSRTLKVTRGKFGRSTRLKLVVRAVAGTYEGDLKDVS
jgi:hypothetical protein